MPPSAGQGGGVRSGDGVGAGETDTARAVVITSEPPPPPPPPRAIVLFTCPFRTGIDSNDDESETTPAWFVSIRKPRCIDALIPKDLAPALRKFDGFMNRREALTMTCKIAFLLAAGICGRLHRSSRAAMKSNRRNGHASRGVARFIAAKPGLRVAAVDNDGLTWSLPSAHRRTVCSAGDVQDRVGVVRTLLQRLDCRRGGYS